MRRGGFWLPRLGAAVTDSWCARGLWQPVASLVVCRGGVSGAYRVPHAAALDVLGSGLSG
jgi:hypothetical protein